MMLEPNTQITVVLTAQQWNTALTLLNEAPRRVVNDIWLSIQQQCQQADAELAPGNVAQFPSSA